MQIPNAECHMPHAFRIPCVILAMCVLIIICATETRSSNIIDMKAYPAAGSYRKYGKTLPICIEISNIGQSFKGTLEINTFFSYRPIKEVFTRKVNLPQNSRKQYFMYIPEYDNYAPEVNIELKAGKKTIAEVKVTSDQIYLKDFLILAFKRDPAGLEYLTNQKLKPLFGKDAQINLAYPAISHLPPHWAGLDSADLIMLCNYPTLSFSKEQEKAMLDWVLSGGVLFVSSSLTSSELSQSPLKEILPVRISDTREISRFPSLEAYCNKIEIGLSSPVIVSSVENMDGTVLVDEEQRPLLVRKKYGKGAVYYFSCDITKPPFDTWKGNIELWERIFNDILSCRREKLLTENSSIAASIPEFSPPSMKKLSFFLFFYVLIVGPLNYFILKRKDRMLFTFITVPLIAVLFTVASFLYGYFTKGSQVIFKVISYCQIQKNITHAPVISYYSLFSPGLSRYNISITAPNSTASELNRVENKNLKIEFQDSGSLELQDLEFDMWSMRTFGAKTIIHLPGTIKYDLSESGGKIRGVIHNKTGIHLKNCVILYNCKISSMFDIRNGVNDIDFDLSGRLANPYEMAAYFVKAYDMNPQGKDIDKKREQIAFLLNVTSSFFTRSDHNVPVILGWSDSDIAGIKLNKSHCNSENSTFFIIE